MIETFTVITLSILFLAFFRPGKTPVLENRLMINRPGRYQISLAARLNLVQPFIEAIAEHIELTEGEMRSSITLFFSVKDKQVASTNKVDGYLLAIIYRGSTFYFQAEYPSSKDTLKIWTLSKRLLSIVLSTFHKETHIAIYSKRKY